MEQFQASYPCIGHPRVNKKDVPKTPTNILGLAFNEKGNAYLIGECTTCNRRKSRPMKKADAQQLLNSGVPVVASGDGFKDFMKGAYNKVFKPLGSKILNNPQRAFEVGQQLGMAGVQAYATKNPTSLFAPATSAYQFAKTGKGFEITKNGY